MLVCKLCHNLAGTARNGAVRLGTGAEAEQAGRAAVYASGSATGIRNYLRQQKGRLSILCVSVSGKERERKT